ncbi:AAA family ATPase [uncultured Propionivibrio sp.]|uniref:AAA family ATPase n=1 Tax=uncultured Propionivibrio sp. TaxID=426737 RepID=UPI0029C0A45A|nr:AAA family ATPase [uncultured Propionivibrio sp.]
MNPQSIYEPRRHVVIECADQTQMRPLDVVLPNFLFRRKVTVLGGPPASGKGAIEAAIAARTSRGGSHPSWPDPTPSSQGKVLFFSGNEDDPEDTLKPRLMAQGADMRNIYFFKGMRQYGNRVDAHFCERDVEALESWMGKVGSGFDLFVVDPIVQAVDGDSTSQAKVLRALDNLAEVSARLNVAILGGHHVVKSAKGRDPLGRVAGPLAYGGKPRAVWVTAHNTNRRTGEDDFVLVNAKASLTANAGGWSYRIDSATVADEYGPLATSVVRWGQRYEGRASDILQQIERAPKKEADALEKAIRFLEKLLQDGPVAYPEIQRSAMESGISGGTLVRAKKERGITHKKQSGSKHGAYYWSLPEHCDRQLAA